MATPFQEYVNAELPNRQIMLQGTQDPRTGSGVASNLGAYYYKTDDGTRYEKTGSADTDWTLLGSAGSANEAEKIVITRNCSTTSSSGDLVYESDSISNGVDVSTSNTDNRNIVGIILSKPTTTTCRVLFEGTYNVSLSGLSKGDKVYLSNSGAITSAKPTSGYVQILGNAIDSDAVNFKPAQIKFKRA